MKLLRLFRLVFDTVSLEMLNELLYYKGNHETMKEELHKVRSDCASETKKRRHAQLLAKEACATHKIRIQEAMLKMEELLREREKLKAKIGDLEKSLKVRIKTNKIWEEHWRKALPSLGKYQKWAIRQQQATTRRANQETSQMDEQVMKETPSGAGSCEPRQEKD